MSNLSIENLSHLVQTGDVNKLVGTGTSQSAASEADAVQAMREEGLAPAGAPSGHTFSEILRDSVDKVNLYQTQADTAIKDLVAGRTKNIHETMLAVERADSSLKMMMQVRNKILDAYKEIMRMQV